VGVVGVHPQPPMFESSSNSNLGAYFFLFTGPPSFFILKLLLRYVFFEAVDYPKNSSISKLLLMFLYLYNTELVLFHASGQNR
jgi:hypothetical protein